jgi:hypothetical protein
MEQLKVRKKDIIILNIVMYLTLSFFFLYLQNAYRHQISPFSTAYFKKGLELFWYVAFILLLSINKIWNHHRSSQLLFQICTFLVSFKVLEGLFLEFNKIIVIALFFFVVISYFLYQLLSDYFSQASINPNYTKNDLFKPLLRDIACKILADDLECTGTLSNWDEKGCFIKLHKATHVPDNVKVVVMFRDREFFQEGEVVSSTAELTGVGIRFHKTVKNLDVFNWTEFIEIVYELGFQPERLR